MNDRDAHVPPNGGAPARRAVVRWAARLVRRDWRQHVAIVVLLAVAVAAAVGLSCAAFNITPASALARLGTATASFQIDEAAGFEAQLDAGAAWFGTIDPIGHRTVPVPGAVVTVDYRVQQPNGPYGSPMLALRSGRYPTSADEAAVTTWVVATTGAGVGDVIDLDGVARTVVGIVENPNDLDDRFVLLAPSELHTSATVEMLVGADADRRDGFRPPGGSRVETGRGTISEGLLAQVVMLVVTTLMLFLVALVATASFAVIAQRRLAQLGMITAIGATQRHVRLTMVASGAVTGVVASVVGVVAGVATWIVVAPHLETSVGARIDPWHLPWWLVAACVVLGTLAASAAAWWPGRSVSRVAPMTALSGRPPRPSPARRSGAVAVVLVAVGAVAVRSGSATTDGELSPGQLLAMAVGLVMLIGGVLLVSPLVIRIVARAARPAPLAARLALRDLGRHQGRSGAALAAISLALGVPVAIAASAAAAENHRGMGNLGAEQLLVSATGIDGPFVPTADDIASLQRGIDAIDDALSGVTITGFDVAADPAATVDPQIGAVPIVSVVRERNSGFENVSSLYVATAATLAVRGTDETVDIATTAEGDLALVDPVEMQQDREQRPAAEPIEVTGTLPDAYSSLPRALITTDALEARGWVAMPAGRWLLSADAPLTSEQSRTVREIAAQHGLTVEARDTSDRLAGIRRGGVVAGMVLALTVLAMTIGLIRAEAAGEVRTLTAAGATSSLRRTITAVTASALALVGALIGTAAAYLGLAAGHLSALTPLPVPDLVTVVVGTPIVASVAGWLLAGREPSAIARRPLA
jgi:putative ABC transport system permease protein